MSLVATALLDAGYPLTLFELKGRVFALIHTLETSGAYVHIPRHDREYAIEVGLRMLTSRHLVIEKDASFAVKPDEITLLRYYANAIAHLLARRSGRCACNAADGDARRAAASDRACDHASTVVGGAFAL